MVFNSLGYFLFLPLTWLIYNHLGQRFRWFFLLLASYLFYASLKLPYLLCVMILVTLVTYGFGRWIAQAKSESKKRHLLWGGISVNVLALIVMKYIPFLTENLNHLLSFFDSPIASYHAPIFIAVGVSYYIFQAISYLSDISLEIEEPEPHFGYFALYLAFFPKLLQGPIERSSDLLPQLRQKYIFNYDNLRYGLLLFVWGLFKKVVIADNLGGYVDTVYNDIHAYQGLPLLLSTYAYAFQIYFDFSGYTDMALGSARLFNINLTDNFNRPYLATSIADFWRRWHITFSRWILDYIFKPLQMKWRDRQQWGVAAALLVTFFVSGLWHGASWGFILWGLLHGLYMASSVFYRPWQKKIHKRIHLDKTRILKMWQIFLTFNLVSFAWIFFRASDVKQALYIIRNIFNIDTICAFLQTKNWEIYLNENILLGSNRYVFTIMITLLILESTIHKTTYTVIFKMPKVARWSVYYVLIFSVILFHSRDKVSFIYFGF